MNRNAEQQIDREPLRSSRDLFVPRYDSFPMNPENSLNKFNIVYPYSTESRNF